MKKMTKHILTITMLTALFLHSCQEAQKQENTGTATTVERTNDAIVTSSSTDKDGNEMALTFNNTKGTATLDFNGETIELAAQKAASGIWYKNDRYELRGKGNDITLKKDGTVIFEHKDDKVNVATTNDNGDVLNMTFNNTEGTVKAYLNGGEQIDLTEEKAASGIWYKNDQYELRGKGDRYELLKDGKTVFKN